MKMRDIINTVVGGLMEDDTRSVSVLYHGCCEDSADNLVARGWSPNSWTSGGNMGDRRYLYLTTGEEDALWFANEKGCDSIVAVTNVPIDCLIVDPEDGTWDTVEEELSNKNGLPGKVALTKSLSAKHFRKIR